MPTYEMTVTAKLSGYYDTATEAKAAAEKTVLLRTMGLCVLKDYTITITVKE